MKPLKSKPIVNYVLLICLSILISLFFSAKSYSQVVQEAGTLTSWGNIKIISAENENIQKVETGRTHNLALRNNGSLLAWGGNSRGQSEVPRDIGKVTEIAVGDLHNLALLEDGTVVAWGDNSSGQIDVPDGLTDVISIYAGGNYSLALKSDGTLVDWGFLNFNPLPDNLQDVKQVAISNSSAVNTTFAVALLDDGSLVSWGVDRFVEQLPEITDFVKIAAGQEHVLGLREDGTVFAWGNNTLGQAAVPFGLSNVVDISAGPVYSLALKSDGSVTGWGALDTFTETLPDVSILSNVKEVEAGEGVIVATKNDDTIEILTNLSRRHGDEVPPQPLYDIIAADGARNETVLAVRKNGSLVVIGGQFFKLFVPPGNDFVDVAGTSNHALYLKSDGSVIAVGTEVLIDGSPSAREIQLPDEVSNVVKIDIGSSFESVTGLFIREDSTVVVVEFDENNVTDSFIIDGLNDAVDVAAGGGEFILRANGTLVPLGNPDVVPSFTDLIQIEAGGGFFLGLRSNGTVVSWGNSQNAGFNIPPDGLTDIVEIAASSHSVALDANGNVFTWGNENFSNAFEVPEYLNKVIKLGGATGSSTFVITETPEGVNTNDSPVVLNPIPEQSATVNDMFTFTTASNTFEDPDGDNLLLTASLVGGVPLPAWLTFTDNGDMSGVFSGIPPESETIEIVVVATDPGGLSDSTKFTMNILTETFGPPNTFGSTIGVIGSIFVSDLDGDGDLDMITGDENADEVAWYENDGSGTFGDKQIIDVVQRVQSVHATDTDGDGDPDIIIASARSSVNTQESEHRVAWYQNDGAGNFGPQQIISDELTDPKVAITKDIDGDGDPDIIVAQFGANRIVWFENDGNGNFGAQEIITDQVNGPWSLFADDIDGDGDIDVASASIFNEIAWYKNDGNGIFADKAVITDQVDRAESVFVSDLDGDGNKDVVYTSRILGEDEGNKLAWNKNNGDGTFSQQLIISSAHIDPVSVSVSDLDGDLNNDILLVSRGKSSGAGADVVWYENNGSGDFESKKIISADRGTKNGIIADIDGDSTPDVIYHDSRSFSWAKNLMNGFTVSAEEEFAEVPNEFTLNQNFPNPFNPTTAISFSLPEASEVILEVYNVVGQKVATLIDQQMTAGIHRVDFDASNLSSGVYLYKIAAGNFVQTRKLTLIK